MGKPTSREIRITVWWGVVVAAASALAFTYPPPERVVACASIVLGAALTSAGLEHGWFRPPLPIGYIPRAIFVLIAIWFPVGIVAYFIWPPKSVVFVKPGIWINPNGPHSGWTFSVVVRGNQPVYNVRISMEDFDRNEELNKQFLASKSLDEQVRLSGEMEPLIFTYPELDPATEGTDREVATFNLETGLSRNHRYGLVITFRGVDEREFLNMFSPPDRTDWQYKMKILWNGDKPVIDCQDPRYPNKSSGENSYIPQCFPEYGGKLMGIEPAKR